LCLATNTETEKGVHVKKCGTDINFPFSLTAMTQTRQTGKFKSPPNAEVSEYMLQEYFINECRILQKLEKSQLEVQDSHSIPFWLPENQTLYLLQKEIL